MTSEAVSEAAAPDVASPALVALVAKREQELSGVKPSAPVSAAPKSTEPVEPDESAPDAGQAEEVEAERSDATEAPDEGKPEVAKKPLDVEWAKSDALKRRISTLNEAGHLDDELLGLIRQGVERKEHMRAANKRFEEAADLAKSEKQGRAQIEKERDEYRARYEGLVTNPRVAAALNGTDDVDDDTLTPDERKLKQLEKDVADMKAEKDNAASAAKSQQARIREIEAWAEDHKASFAGTVSDEEYEAALTTSLKELLEDEIDPRAVLTQKGLARRVSRVLERQREDKDVQSLRERAEGSKRDVVRSARASSPAGVRTEVGKTYPPTPEGQRQKRIAETLAKYPPRPD